MRSKEIADLEGELQERKHWKFSLAVLARFPNPTGLEAHDAPYAAGILHVHAGVAVAARDVAFRACGSDFGTRGHQSRRSVEANLAVAQVNRAEVNGAGAQTGQGLIF